MKLLKTKVYEVRTLNKLGRRGGEQIVDSQQPGEWIERDDVIFVDDVAVLIVYPGSLQDDVLSDARPTASNPCLACIRNHTTAMTTKL